MAGKDYEVPAGLSADEGSEIDAPRDAAVIERELIIDQFKEVFEDLDEKRSPREKVFDEAFAMYNNQFDWTGKSDWQSKIGLPHIREIVDRAAASFRKALMRMEQFYQIESETREGIEKGNITKEMINYYLGQNDTDFDNQFADALNTGLITGCMIFKVWWKWSTCHDPRMVEKMRKEKVLDPMTGAQLGTTEIPYQAVDTSPYNKGSLGIQAIDPYNFWHDKARGICIERSVVDLSYVWHLYEQGIYKDKAAIESLAAASDVEITRFKEARRKGENPGSGPKEFSREVELYHYWGNVYSRDGKILKENVSYTLASAIPGRGAGLGKLEMLRAPQSNGFLHKLPPYVIGTPYRVPFSSYHRGIVEDAMPIVSMIIELANSVVDGAQFEAAGGNEIDFDLLENPSQLDKGIYPGISITTKGLENPQSKQVIRNLTVGKVPQGALQVIQWLTKEKEMSTSITSGLLGVPVNTRTSSEFNSSMANANEGLDDAARTIEETLINPTLDLIAKTIYQYHDDYNLPRLVENFPQSSLMLGGMTPEERYAAMIGGFQFRARGISIYLDKMQDRQDVTQFIQGIGMLPGVLPRINIDGLLEEFTTTFGFNPQKILMQPSSQGVVAAGQSAPGTPGMDPDMAGQSPMQIAAGQQGAALGGSTNNPMAIGGKGGGY